MLAQAMEAQTNQLRRLNPLHNPLWSVVASAPAILLLLFTSYLPDWVPFVLIAWLLVVYLLRSQAIGRFVNTPVDIPLALLLILVPLGLFVTPDIDVSLPRVYAYIGAIAICRVVADTRNHKFLHWVSWGIIAAGIALVVVFVLGTKFPPPFAALNNYRPLSWTPFWNSAGFNPNLSGGMMGLLVFPIAALAWRGKNLAQRLLALLILPFVALMPLLTWTRGSMLGIGVALVLLTTLITVRWLLVWGIVGVVAAVALQTQQVTTLLTDRFINSADAIGGIDGRVEIWSRGLYMIQDFPFTGVGQGMVESVVHLLYPLFLIAPTTEFKHLHNLYLDIAASQGLPSLIIHLALIFVIVFCLVKKIRGTARDYYWTLSVGLMGTMIVFLVHSMLEVLTYGTRPAVVIWGLFGLMVAVSTSKEV